jgi:hypothetical protein
MAEETVMSGVVVVVVTTAAIIAPVVMGMARIVSIRPREACLMKKICVACLCAFVISTCFSVSFAEAHGGDHHPEPGHNGSYDCALGSGFHHYDNGNYGQGKNIWCDNGNSHLLGQHHRGNQVKADLPTDSSFVGGFCMKADITDGEVLKIAYSGLVGHDKIWLLASDGVYYPIDKNTDENFILVKEGDWADRDATSGKIEADVLLSARYGNNSHNAGGSGGGCNSGASFLIGLAAVGGLAFVKKSK